MAMGSCYLVGIEHSSVWLLYVCGTCKILTVWEYCCIYYGRFSVKQIDVNVLMTYDVGFEKNSACSSVCMWIYFWHYCIYWCWKWCCVFTNHLILDGTKHLCAWCLADMLSTLPTLTVSTPKVSWDTMPLEDINFVWCVDVSMFHQYNFVAYISKIK